MDAHSEVTVTDKSGWTRKYLLGRIITQIGSDPTNDIVLDAERGGGVFHRHAQLIFWPDNESGCRLVNLGGTEILVGATGDQSLAPRSTMQIFDGQVFQVGDFTLTFHLNEGFTSDIRGNTKHIGLGFFLPDRRLVPHRALEGIITLRNLGNQDRVQFELDLEGLPPNCYQIEPAPLLFPGAEDKVRLHLYHRGRQPLAGERRIVVRVTAPESYPGEEAAIARKIHVLPFYRHQLRLLASKADQAPLSPGWWARWRARLKPSAPAPAEPTRTVEEEQAPETEVFVFPEVTWEQAAQASLPGPEETPQPPEPVQIAHPPRAEAGPEAATQPQGWTAPEAPAEPPSPQAHWVAPEVEFGPSKPAHPPPPQPSEPSASAQSPAEPPAAGNQTAEEDETGPPAPVEEAWEAVEAEAAQTKEWRGTEAKAQPASPTEDTDETAPSAAEPQVIQAQAVLDWEEKKPPAGPAPTDAEDWWAGESDAEQSLPARSMIQGAKPPRSAPVLRIQATADGETAQTHTDAAPEEKEDGWYIDAESDAAGDAS